MFTDSVLRELLNYSSPDPVLSVYMNIDMAEGTADEPIVFTSGADWTIGDQLPGDWAGIIFHDGIAIGKFQGVMKPQTPSGWRMVMLNLLRSSDGVVIPKRRRPSPAM